MLCGVVNWPALSTREKAPKPSPSASLLFEIRSFRGWSCFDPAASRFFYRAPNCRTSQSSLSKTRTEFGRFVPGQQELSFPWRCALLPPRRWKQKDKWKKQGCTMDIFCEICLQSQSLLFFIVRVLFLLHFFVFFLFFSFLPLTQACTRWGALPETPTGAIT